MTACAIGRTPEEARERIRRRIKRAGQRIDPDEYRSQRGPAAVLGTLYDAASSYAPTSRRGWSG